MEDRDKRLKRPGAVADSEDMRLDDRLPRWHLRERHRLRTCAEPAGLLAAAEEVTWAEVPLMRTLMRVRTAGRIPFEPTGRVLDGMRRIGLTVLDRTPDELVVGGTGRPWRVGGGQGTEGWAEMALNFRVADGALHTETRVWLTTSAARRRFTAYWLIIRPWSGLIRREWLRAIARRALTSVTGGG